MGTLKPIIHSRTRQFKFTHYAGPPRSQFLMALRDAQKIMGNKCPECGRVYVPARSMCHVCFKPLDKWVEVSSEGTLTTYTVVHQAEPVHPVNTPFIYGIIKLDGADTGIAHMIGGVRPEQIKIGMRMKAVFNEKRTGSILDIKYFIPV